MASSSKVFVTTQQCVYNYVRERILSGDYVGGAHLDLKEIADVLDVSRMPVRDALRQLDAEGLVIMRPNRGTIVTSLTPSEVEQLFEMRAALETLTMQSVVSKLNDDAIGELEVLKDRMDRARHDRLLWIQRHNEFHQFISDLSQKRLLAQEINRLQAAVQPYLLMYISIYGKTEMEGYEHDELLAAILSRDVARAEICMHDHVFRASVGIISFLKDRVANDSDPTVRQESSQAVS